MYEFFRMNNSVTIKCLPNKGQCRGQSMGAKQQEMAIDSQQPAKEGGNNHDQTKTEELSRDDVFDILRNSRRREVLRYLDSLDDGETTLSDLAEEIAAKEHDTTVDAITSSQRKRVYIGLYQGHLPKMADRGIIEYDKNRGTVKLKDMSQLAPHLYSPEADERLTTPVVAAVTFSAFIVVGLVAIESVPATAWALLSTGGLFLWATYQYLSVQ